MPAYFIKFPSLVMRDDCMYDICMRNRDLYGKSTAGEFLPDIIVRDPTEAEINYFSALSSEVQIFEDIHFNWVTSVVDAVDIVVQEAIAAKTLIDKNGYVNPMFELVKLDLDKVIKYAKAARTALDTAKKL